MTQEELIQEFARQDAEARREALRALLATPIGRKLLWWLFEIAPAIGAQPFNRDAGVMAFECGRVDVGNRLLAELIEANPEGFVTLMQEMERERRERADRVAGAPRRNDDGGYDG